MVYGTIMWDLCENSSRGILFTPRDQNRCFCAWYRLERLETAIWEMSGGAKKTLKAFIGTKFWIILGFSMGFQFKKTSASFKSNV